MARQVLPWVGAAVGFWIGGPAGAQAGFAIGGLVGNAIDPQVINGPKLGEGQDNNASEGGYRPIVLGKGAVGVCMIHEGPLKKRTIRHKQSKGGGPVTTEERAYRTMAFALGESAFPDKGVRLTRLWIDNKLRYDITPTSQIQQESAEFESEFTFYPGDNNQQPDPDLEAFLGAGNVPSYRGGSPYIVFPDWDVTDSRGMAPMIKAELVSDGDMLAPMYITGSSFGWRFQMSPDGSDWMGEVQEVGAANTHLVSGPNRVLMYHGSLMEYTDDHGETFTSVPSPPQSSGAGYKGIYLGDQFWLPCGLNGYATSPNGADWTSHSIRGGASSYTICGTEEFVVMAGLYANVDGTLCNTRYMVNGIGAWSDNMIGLRRRDDHSLGETVSASGTDGDIVVVGGHAHSMAYTTNGSTWFQIVSPFVNGPGTRSTQMVGAIKYGRDAGGQGLWVAVSTANVDGSLGQTAWSRNGKDNWQLLPNGFGGNVKDMEYANGRFVAIGDGPVIKELTDVNVGWVTLPNSWVGSWSMKSITSYPFRAVTAGSIPLYQVIQWIHGRIDMPQSKIDTSELIDDVEGIVFSDGYTAADAIRTQMALYFFDAGEYDAGLGYRINYVKRGGSASVTLTDADIVDGPEDWEREDSYERPRALHVAYQNPVADYGAPNITIKRTSPDVLVVGERSASVPNVFSDVDEITQRADIMMTVIYSEIAGTYDITLPVSWLELAPTDCIGFSIRGRTRRLRMTNWRFSPDGTIKTEWMADRQSAYTSNVTGLPVVPPTPPPPSIVGPTVSAVLDIPALVDALDSLHLVIAASGQTEAWYGSIHQRKLPSDADYATMAQFSAPTTIMGTLQVAVSSASPHYTDTTSVVRVKLYSDDDLDTYTQEQFLSEHGAFALAWEDSGDTRWEVCQYRDAVKVGDMEWELTTLLRGRLNTEAEEHPVGSLFVLLDSGIRVAPAQSSWIGQDITHRAVSNGQLPDNAVPYVETYTGESQREWPVAHVLLDLVGDNLSVDIVPRHRFGTDDHPMRSLNWDGYRIEATDGVNSAALTTTSDGGDFDVTGWSGTITVTVAQLNRITGAGPTVSETIEA